MRCVEFGHHFTLVHLVAVIGEGEEQLLLAGEEGIERAFGDADITAEIVDPHGADAHLQETLEPAFISRSRICLRSCSLKCLGMEWLRIAVCGYQFFADRRRFVPLSGAALAFPIRTDRWGMAAGAYVLIQRIDCRPTLRRTLVSNATSCMRNDQMSQ